MRTYLAYSCAALATLWGCSYESARHSDASSADSAKGVATASAPDAGTGSPAATDTPADETPAAGQSAGQSAGKGSPATPVTPTPTGQEQQQQQPQKPAGGDVLGQGQGQNQGQGSVAQGTPAQQQSTQQLGQSSDQQRVGLMIDKNGQEAFIQAISDRIVAIEAAMAQLPDDAARAPFKDEVTLAHQQFDALKVLSLDDLKAQSVEVVVAVERLEHDLNLQVPIHE